MVLLQIIENIFPKRKNYQETWSKVLSVSLFLMSMVILLPLIYHFSIGLKPSIKHASQGQISIMPSDFSERQTIALSGNWAFFWKQLLAPQQVKQNSDLATFIPAKGGWQDNKRFPEYQAIGYGTYFVEVNLHQTSKNLALDIPHIETAYRLFINSDLVASGGTVSDTLLDSAPGYHSTIVGIPDGLNSFSVLIQVSNYHSSWGGLWQPIVIGDRDSLHTLHRDKVALSMFILGALLITVIHSLIQFFLRPSNSIPLIFACLCLLLFLREFTVEHMSFAFSTFSGGFALITKLNFFSFYAGIPAALYFFHLCHPREFHQKLCRIIYATCVIFSAFILFSPTQYFGLSIQAFQIIALVVMLYILQRTGVAMRNNRKGAGIMLLGSLIAFGFALNDILNMNNIIDTGRFFSLGIIGFLTCQIVVTSSRFDNFIDQNVSLTEKLKERNSDLEIMSRLLETKVEQRTQQLQKANKELKALANIDPLTKTLNRNGLQQHIQSALARYRRSDSAFSILIIDYDHFKEVNDTYGHDVGDLVLITGADIIRDQIRDQDKLARWGGEEFLILLPDTDLQGALFIGNKLKEAISAKPIGQPVGIEITVTGGVAQINRGESFDSLFKRADNALYKGKNQGRNQICA